MTHKGTLLLPADQTPLAERDLLGPAKSLVYCECLQEAVNGNVFGIENYEKANTMCVFALKFWAYLKYTNLLVSIKNFTSFNSPLQKEGNRYKVVKEKLTFMFNLLMDVVLRNGIDVV